MFKKNIFMKSPPEREFTYIYEYIYIATSRNVDVLQITKRYAFGQTWQFGNDIQMILGDLHKHVG